MSRNVNPSYSMLCGTRILFKKGLDIGMPANTSPAVGNV